MKPTLLTGILFLLMGTLTYAQFSLLPSAGFEQSRNSVLYGSGFSAADINGNLKAGLRAAYRLKGEHSPFINLTTSPAAATFTFDRAGSLLNNAEAIKSSLRFRVEAGYQYSTKPIQLGKKSPSTAAPSIETAGFNRPLKKSCGTTTVRSHCGSKNKQAKTQLVNNNLNMRLQPSLAFAYIPSSSLQTLKQTAGGFTYTAGAWKTALVPSIGFAFAKGATPLFTLSAFYTKPFGQKEETAVTQIESKSISTALRSQASAWGLTLGVPFSFTRSRAKKVINHTERTEHTRTHYRKCGRLQ